MARLTTSMLWLTAVLLLWPGERASATTMVPAESALLFNGPDASFVFERMALSDDGVQSELVGIVVDGREMNTQVVYRYGDDYYLPASILSEIGVQGSARAGHLFLNTPGGEVATEQDFFRDIQNQVFFSTAMLDDVLKIQWEFSSEKYAFMMTLPWWQQSRGSQDLFADPGELDIDFEPTSFGLTQIRLDHTLHADRNNNSSQSNLLLRGRLAEGTWRGELIEQPDRDTRAEDYYWLRDFKHVQALVGNQQVLINPLLPSVETTGVQALYSSKALEFDPHKDQTRSQYIRRFGIPVKEIEGVALPGSIAELRVDERAIARVRVKLDGTYSFDQVRNNSLQFQTVKVFILDQRSLMELEVQDFTRTPIDLQLDKGQTVTFGGIGSNGNLLDPSLDTQGGAVFGLARYGLTENLTVEAGLQSANGRVHQVAGFSASFLRQWATTMSFGHHEGAYGYSSDLYGRGKNWQLTARMQNYENGFRSAENRESKFNELRYEYWLSRKLSVGAQGRSARSGDNKQDFLLPGFTWRFGHRNSVRVWPDFNGDYALNVRTSHRKQDWFEYTHDSRGAKAEYRYFQNTQLEFFGRLSQLKTAERTSVEVGTIWYPNVYDDRSLLTASMLSSDGGTGYRLTWQTTVLPGLFSNLELRDEPLDSEFSDPGLQLRWTLSVDLSIANGRPVPARNDFIQSRTGSISGRLLLANGESLQSTGIKQVAILIDGRPHTAVLRGKHFFVRNITPGVYDVELGSKHLPMTLSPEKIRYRVRVSPTATTSVDFTLNYEFGLTGQVTDDAGQPVAALAVQIWDSEANLVHKVTTDAYGYYQFSGLKPDTYTLKVSQGDTGPVEQTVIIDDAFVFDVNLVVEKVDAAACCILAQLQ